MWKSKFTKIRPESGPIKSIKFILLNRQILGKEPWVDLQKENYVYCTRLRMKVPWFSWMTDEHNHVASRLSKSLANPKFVSFAFEQ